MTATEVYGDQGQKVAAERRLARLEDRYRNELTDEEERLELRDRIRQLKKSKAGRR